MSTNKQYFPESSKVRETQDVMGRFPTQIPVGRIVNVSSGLGSITLVSDRNHGYFQVRNMPYQSSKAAVNAITVEFAILNNFIPEHVRRDGKKGFVMEKQQIMDEVLTIQQMAQISGLSAHTLNYYECAGLLPQLIGHNEANEYRYHTQKKLLALNIHF